MAKYAKCARFKDGDTLFHAGQRDMKFYVVKKGEVEIIDHSGDTPKQVVIHPPGHFTGDITHLTGRPAIVSAVAKGDVQAYEVCHDDLQKILQGDPRLSDLILQAFIARRQLLENSPEFVGLRVIGSRYSRDTFRIRDFLSRNHIPFTSLDLETDPHVGKLLESFGIKPDETPVVSCGRMLILRNPSNKELADEVGVHLAPQRKTYDLIVIGGGPAGLAAAVYGASEGLSTLVVEKEAPGGQAGASMRIENYLGFPLGITGAELAKNATLQANKFGAELSISVPAVSLEFDGPYSVVKLDGQNVSAKALLIATGAEYGRLPAINREKFEGSGVYYAATPLEAATCKGQQVVVVGGGNSAGQAAVYLAEQMCHVILMIRGDDLYKNMSYYLARRIEGTSNIEIKKNTIITKMDGDDHLRQIEIENTATKERKTLDVVAVFTFIGATPRTDWLNRQLGCDKKGFIVTGSHPEESTGWTLNRSPFLLETNRPGVFAAGDVRYNSVKRVASAVGEGAMAVQFVHRYLAEI
ncbi:MAG TPA: FAD-dependent oxidoreductase [Tepidisphaeraceae bacterium]|nr:FAD-dependent oxidoreductase [Tepidisphaeraceae bacterium]